jgi:hypothetical protein
MVAGQLRLLDSIKLDLSPILTGRLVHATSDSDSIWNPDHLDRIWKNGIDMYLTCTYMLRNVKHVHTWYVHVYTMYVQIGRCTYMSVHLCKFLYVSCT